MCAWFCRCRAWQLSDAEIAKRLAEMNQKKAVPATSATSNAEPAAPPVVKHAGPTYYLAPLRGQVGTSMIASNLEKMLADAATSLADGGGDPDGFAGRGDRGSRSAGQRHHQVQKQMRIVVWVHKAISAAAITSLCVDEIYVQKGAVFGAASVSRDQGRVGGGHRGEDAVGLAGDGSECGRVGESSVIARGGNDRRLDGDLHDQGGREPVAGGGRVAGERGREEAGQAADTDGVRGGGLRGWHARWQTTWMSLGR